MMVKVDPCEQNLDLIFLIDRSGSMYGSEKDTIGGFNSFIKREKDKGLNTKVTTILFDHGYDVLYKRKDINDVCDLTSNEYYVRGSTALLDAIGRTIVTLEKEICNKVLFVIMTDGMENSSVEFSKSQISYLSNAIPSLPSHVNVIGLPLLYTYAVVSSENPLVEEAGRV